MVEVCAAVAQPDDFPVLVPEAQNTHESLAQTTNGELLRDVPDPVAWGIRGYTGDLPDVPARAAEPS